MVAVKEPPAPVGDAAKRPKELPAYAVTIYTDGACDPNPGPGGWAAILRFRSHTRELTGAEADTTNNRMELRAAVEALKALKQPCRVELHTDSEYLQRGISEWMQGWQASNKKKRPANWDLWQELLEAARPHAINWHWVRGHAGDSFNERADRLATSMIPASPLPLTDPAAAHVFPGASCLGKAAGPGGWGVVVRWDGTKQEFSGPVPETTANRLHLLAVEEGLRRAPPDRPIRVYTAAKYLHRGATEWIAGWQRSAWPLRAKDGLPVKNQDVWRKLVDASTKLSVYWHFVKGEPPPELARAGELAAQAARGVADSGK